MAPLTQVTGGVSARSATDLTFNSMAALQGYTVNVEVRMTRDTTTTMIASERRTNWLSDFGLTNGNNMKHPNKSIQTAIDALNLALNASNEDSVFVLRTSGGFAVRSVDGLTDDDTYIPDEINDADLFAIMGLFNGCGKWCHEMQRLDTNYVRTEKQWEAQQSFPDP